MDVIPYACTIFFLLRQSTHTDYLDLMLLHQPFGDTYGAWRALEELYKEGKLHAIGISNHYTDRMVEFANFTNIKPMVNQMETHPLNQQKTLNVNSAKKLH